MPRYFRLPKLPAPAPRIRKGRVFPYCLFHARKQELEMNLQQMLQETTGDCVSQIILRIATPSVNELPNFFGVRVDVVCDMEDRLPAIVLLTFRRGYSGEK